MQLVEKGKNKIAIKIQNINEDKNRTEWKEKK